MKLFTTILLIMFISACTDNTTVVEEPAGSSSVVKSAPTPLSSPGANSAKLPHKPSDGNTDKGQNAIEIPIVNVVPAGDTSSSGVNVPEKE